MKEQVISVILVACGFGLLYITLWDTYKKWIGIK